jgi:hypothetical protein
MIFQIPIFWTSLTWGPRDARIQEWASREFGQATSVGIPRRRGSLHLRMGLVLSLLQLASIIIVVVARWRRRVCVTGLCDRRRYYR